MQQVNGSPQHRQGRLPQKMKDRESFVGVKIIKSPNRKDGHEAKFTISKQYLREIGNPKKVSIRGRPENGYLISDGKDVKPSILPNTNSVYITTGIDRVNMPKAQRGAVWMRAEIDGKRIRVPPLPAAWIAGDPDFAPGSAHEEGNRDMHLSRTPGDDAVRAKPSQTQPIAGGAPLPTGTSPLPKKTLEYRLPENISVHEAQLLLGQKLGECRVIIEDLQRRTGMRFTLTRNFVLTVDLAAKIPS